MKKSIYLTYGLVGIPLAFGALPLYMHLPKFYSESCALSLSVIGAMLWLVRLFDGFTDPYFGAFADSSNRRKLFTVSMVIFLVAFIFLFHPLDVAPLLKYVWLFITLLITSISFSAANVVFLTWGASLGDDSQSRGQLVACREVFTLIAVIIASVLPTLFTESLSQGVKLLCYVCVFLGVLALFGVKLLPDNDNPKQETVSWQTTQYFSQLKVQFLLLWDNFESRYLLMIFLFNGVASAIPAILFLFYVEDVLGQPKRAGAFLGLYFLAGVIALPFWTQANKRVSRVALWKYAMILAIGSFALAGLLGSGDGLMFIIVCLASGAALGADLCLPASMAADWGEKQQHSGVIFGWWNLLAKLTLAVAAGLALPVLSIAGYEAGAGYANATALKWSYVVLPISIKGIALWLLIKKQHHLQEIR